MALWRWFISLMCWSSRKVLDTCYDGLQGDTFFSLLLAGEKKNCPQTWREQNSCHQRILVCLAIFPPQPPLPIHSSVPAACAFLEALFMRNFHCITTQCMTQFIRSGEVSIFTLYLFLSLPLLCALLSFKKSRPTHTLAQRGRERESVMHTLASRPKWVSLL